MKNQKPSAAARVIVLAGPALALLYTLFTLTGGNDFRFIPGVWFLAAIWSFLTALAGVLWRTFHGDWTAFTGYTLPEENAEQFDWATRTGRYAWRRDYEEGGLYDDDHPGHGPIT